MSSVNSATRPRSLSRWHGRDVHARSGVWGELRHIIPTFAFAPFAVAGDPDGNPHLRSIVRLPPSEYDVPVPVGVVSPRYGLVQHRDFGDICIGTLQALDLYYERLRCDLELSELGEWMHLRLHLGDALAVTPPDGHPLDLCVDAYNSVDGSSRLLLTMSWHRLVCDNGLIVRDAATALDATHDRDLDPAEVANAIERGIGAARVDMERLQRWWDSGIADEALVAWVDGPVAAKWGKSAATRCLAISRDGADGQVPPFQTGKPSERLVENRRPVPGAAVPVRTAYDAGQVLAWIAGTRANVDERLAWQTDIPGLVEQLEI